MKFVWYEDRFCYYVWKPSGIPTTFWKEKSFLEMLLEEKNHPMVKDLMVNFTREEEYWLLNRLDKIKEEYRQYQKEWKIRKYYLAEVYWDIQYRIKENGVFIEYPIVHHKFSEDRMVVIKTDEDLKKWESRLHCVKTEIKECCYDKDRQISIVIISIQKWIRHQIRSHLSSIWYPIVGDVLYWKKKDPKKWDLQLFSVGLQTIG